MNGDKKQPSLPDDAALDAMAREIDQSAWFKASLKAMHIAGLIDDVAHQDFSARIKASLNARFEREAGLDDDEE